MLLIPDFWLKKRVDDCRVVAALSSFPAACYFTVVAEIPKYWRIPLLKSTQSKKQWQVRFFGTLQNLLWGWSLTIVLTVWNSKALTKALVKVLFLDSYIVWFIPRERTLSTYWSIHNCSRNSSVAPRELRPAHQITSVSDS